MKLYYDQLSLKSKTKTMKLYKNKQETETQSKLRNPEEHNMETPLQSDTNMKLVWVG